MSNAFQNAHLLGFQIGKIRKLSGFRKGHRIPEDHFEAATEFVRKIGQDEVRLQAETLHGSIRSTFSYKRKQLVYVCEAGVAAIQTPDFEVNITIGQDEVAADQFMLKTEVNGFQNSDISEHPGFCSVFNPCCDRLVVDFLSACNLEAKIDAIEANEQLEPFLDYEPDCSSLTLSIPTPNIRFKITPHQMLITLPGTRDLRQLIDHCKAAFDTFAQAGLSLTTD